MDAGLVSWDDPFISKGRLTFEMDEFLIPQGIKLDQKNLLDVDFTELDVIKYS